MSSWGTPIELETRRRIVLSYAAYAYEYLGETIMSDGDFDSLSLEVNLSIKTGNSLMDDFFEQHFEPHTGSWIRKHPEKIKIIQALKQYYSI